MTSLDASAHLRDASGPLSVTPSPIRSLPDNVPSWPRPRSPIPPHRLAKLVNALGISAPVPARSPSDPLAPPSPSLSLEARRSPVPSLASTSNSPAPLFQSRFLLHVVPTLHIPHESSASENFELTPPPPSASGYHPQFQRGTLVPLLPTLQGQLWAIAKEYALPSTAGMILYLVSSAPSPNPDTTSDTTSTTLDEPGPRLSEDIWKHLWTRVAKFETESYSRAITPNNTTAGLGFGYGGPPSPLFPQSSNTLRPLLSPNHIAPQSFPPPLTPTESIASSNPPTQATFSEPSQSEVDTPDSSLPSDSRAATLDLPGLTSPSIIPILAKVEFDIDKRKAAWYGPWIRSRKLNHQKRENRARTTSESGTSPVAEGASQGEGDALKAAPLPLKLVDRQAIPRFLLSVGIEGDDGYDSVSPRLSESPPNLEDPDPVGTELSGPAESEHDSANDNDEEEVQASSESQERPRLSLNIPPSPPSATVLSTAPTAGMGTANTYKKAAPPPLTLMPYTFNVTGSPEPSPLMSSSSTGLAYLRDGVSTPSEGDKRTGTVFDELDLGLDFEDTGEFDEDDPNDRRRSQYVLKAKLDEIEKTLVRLSPRTLQHETQPQNPPVKSSSPSSLSLPSVNGPTPGSANSLSSHSDASWQSPAERESNGLPSPPSAVWPTVPHSSLKLRARAGSSSGSDNLLALPKLSLNGTPGSIPVSPYKKSFSELEDSKARGRGPDDYEPAYPEVVTSSSREPTSSSPRVIPLSPDPFGRYPFFPSTPSSSQPSPLLDKPQHPMTRSSVVEVPPEQRASGSHSHRDSLTSTIQAASRPPSSRFSLDSTDEGKNNRISASLNPVKSIKSLWKKGRKASISYGTGSIVAALQIGSSPPSPLPPPPPVPSVSNTSSPRSLTPAPSTASRESVTSLVIPSDRHAPKAPSRDTPSFSTSQLQQSRSNPTISSMVFNQESPYPVHVLPSNATRRRTASQTARAISSASLTDAMPLPPPPPPPPSLLEKEKVAVPKSILKSRRTESSTSTLSTEQHTVSRSQSRIDAVLGRSTSSSGGGRITPPSSSSESIRTSLTKSRQRTNPPPLPSQPSPDS